LSGPHLTRTHHAAICGAAGASALSMFLDAPDAVAGQLRAEARSWSTATSPGNWYSFRDDDKMAVLCIFGEIGLGQSADDLVYALDEVRAPKLEVILDCPGGDTLAALRIYDYLAERKPDVFIHRAWSAAVVVACAGGNVTIAGGGSMMVHAAIGACLGDGGQLRAVANRVDAANNRVFNILHDRTRRLPSVVREWLSKDTWFDPAQALTAGLVDAIAPKREARPAPVPIEPPAPETALIETLAKFSGMTVRSKAAVVREMNALLATTREETQL